MGKGSAPRNCFSEAYRDGWDRVFGGDREIDGGPVELAAPDGGSTPPSSRYAPDEAHINRMARQGYYWTGEGFVKQ